MWPEKVAKEMGGEVGGNMLTFWRKHHGSCGVVRYAEHAPTRMTMSDDWEKWEKQHKHGEIVQMQQCAGWAGVGWG